MAKNTSILLGDYFDNFINSQIKTGKYSSASEVVTLAETIRCAVSNLKILNHASLLESTVTVSIGICTLHTTAPADIEHAINTADKAMYLAKSCGRNCVRSLHAPPRFSKDANP